MTAPEIEEPTVAAGVTVRRNKRDKPKTVIPTKAEMRALVMAARASQEPMDAPLAVTDVFTGLRASELRGLAWEHVGLKARTLSVEQRADAKNNIGPPKSAAGRRVIPLADAVVSELRKWKLRCPKTELDLVFPSKAGKPLSHTILHKLHLWPITDAAGIPRYTSHALRHSNASGSPCSAIRRQPSSRCDAAS